MDRFSALKAFTRVVEAGSFTRAADSLNMPNATLSKTIQQLEAHLGVSLLQRTTRRITVTPEGREYYEKPAVCWKTRKRSTRLSIPPAISRRAIYGSPSAGRPRAMC
nr:Ben and cat operon transcriptional regulator [Klebsiella pneumoniae]